MVGEQRPVHVLLRLAATLASAALYGCSFPLVGVRGFAWAALVPFLVAVRRSGATAAVALAAVWTVAGTYAVADWLPASVSIYYQQPLRVGIALFLGVAAGVFPYLLAFVLGYRRIARTPTPFVPLVAGATWAAIEWGRATLVIGDPWGTFGYSQSGIGPVVQIADVTGVYGLSFVLVMVNAALAEVWLTRRDEAHRPGALRGLAVAGGVLVLVLTYGQLRLAAAPAGPGDAPTRVAIIQGNLDMGSQWRQEFYGSNLDIYLGLTRAALERERPTLVVWPESAMTFFLDQEPAYRAALRGVLEPYDAALIAGAPRFRGRPEAAAYYNSAFLISPGGDIVASYDKQRLLPFAEYFPIPALDFLRRRFARVRQFTPGESKALLPTAAGPAGVVICNEAVFPDLPGERVRAGAAYLVNPANDTWVDDPRFSSELFDMVSLRAVEQRRYLVRASTSGFSAIVDPWGRTTAVTKPFTRGWVVGSIEGRDGVTIYGRFGDLFVGVALAATLIGHAALAARRPRVQPEAASCA